MRELERAEHNQDAGDPGAARSLRKLEGDVERAEGDLRIAKLALERGLDLERTAIGTDF